SQTPKPVPNKNPSTASRRRIPNLPSPIHLPNRDRANRLSNHHHPDRGRAPHGGVRRNWTRLFLRATRCLTGQKNAKRHRNRPRYERQGFSSHISRNRGGRKR